MTCMYKPYDDHDLTSGRKLAENCQFSLVKKPN